MIAIAKWNSEMIFSLKIFANYREMVICCRIKRHVRARSKDESIHQ